MVREQVRLWLSMSMVAVAAAHAQAPAPAVPAPPQAMDNATITVAPMNHPTSLQLTVVADGSKPEADVRDKLAALATAHDALVTRLLALQLPTSVDSKDDELFPLVAEAVRLAAISKGSLHWSCGELVQLWSDARGTKQLPSAEQRAAAKRACTEDVVVDGKKRTWRLPSRAGAQLWLEGAIRAYALQRVSQQLLEAGFANHLVSANGDVVSAGFRGPSQVQPQAWRVGVKDPRGPDAFAVLPGGAPVVVVHDGTDMVLGDVRMHGFLDPRSSAPASKARLVAVVGPDAATAKILAQALFVLGDDAGQSMLSSCKGYEALWVRANNDVVMSKGMREKARTRAPTP
jgi:FAD:protein FMN transferase